MLILIFFLILLSDSKSVLLDALWSTFISEKGSHDMTVEADPGGEVTALTEQHSLAPGLPYPHSS